jgi:hypothetical protein
MAEHSKAYRRKFRAKMVQRMSGPGGESATGLSRKVGVPQATLSRWLREAGRVGGMNEKGEESPPGARVSKRPEDWTAEEKLKVVAEAVGLDDTELGVLLRREGLHEAQLEAWRKALLGSLEKDSHFKDPMSL